MDSAETVTARWCVLLIVLATLFALFVPREALAQSTLEIAKRRYYGNPDNTTARYFYEPKAYCLAWMGRNFPNYQYVCRADPTATGTIDRVAGTEGPATSYPWYYGGCNLAPGSSGRACTALNSVSPTRYCESGQTPVNGPVSGEKYCEVERPPECKAGEEGVGTWWRANSINDTPINIPFKGASDGQCEIDIYDVPKCYLGTDGKVYCVYKYRKTGRAKPAGPPNSESSGPTPNPPAEKKREDVPPQDSGGGPCPKGTVHGGYTSDGIPSCYGSGSDPKNPKPPPPKTESENTQQNPDGGSTHTKTTKTTNSDGSVTTVTVTTVTRPDGTKETTVTADTSNAANGAPGKDESKQEDEKYDLCKQNPMLTICRNSSVSGTCGQIACQGDAIQCATLRAAAAMECLAQDDKKALEALPSTGLGNSILGGSDPAQGAIDAALKGTEVDMSQSKIDDSSFVAAQCIGDKSFAFAGRTIEVNFSRWCGVIEPLKYAIVACAWILAYQIVARSIIGA